MSEIPVKEQSSSSFKNVLMMVALVGGLALGGYVVKKQFFSASLVSQLPPGTVAALHIKSVADIKENIESYLERKELMDIALSSLPGGHTVGQSVRKLLDYCDTTGTGGCRVIVATRSVVSINYLGFILVLLG